VGQKGRTESVTKVLAALFQRKTWKQAELAREVGLSTEALRKLLKEFEAEGVPLEHQTEHPHVYWSLPKTWFPGGVLFEQKDVPALLQQLRRLPKTKARDRLLHVVADQLPVRVRQEPAAPVVTRTATDHDEQFLPMIEEAGARKVALWMKYLTRGRGSVAERHVSVHLVDAGPPARFFATCHGSRQLRTFRVDNILSARLDSGEPFREADADGVKAYRAAGLDGFTGSGASIGCSFFVRDPEARWVSNNLLEGMRVEPAHGGIRVLLETNATERLSRFVVGLGAAAHPETRELAEAVLNLARGALEQASAALSDTSSDRHPLAAERDPAQPLSDV
jgi:predicted DNA-binding transcriptional regulator YafY